jgi:phosphoribosylanthranilate isomerase
MRTRVKYCGMVRPHDVDAAVAIGADAVGFVFYPRSPRLLDVETAAALRRRLPSWVSAVGLFVNEPAAVIESISRSVGLDVVQLHGDETPADAKALPTAWWKAIRIEAARLAGDDAGLGGVGRDGGVSGAAGEPPQGAILRSLEAFREAEFCLLDSASAGYGGSGKTFDWSVVPPDVGRRLIMSGGLDANNVGAAIASVRPFGVDTSTGIQGRDPREKDVGRMEQFMEAVRRADAPASSTKQ